MQLVLLRPLAFFDLETTGTRIGKDRIVQIGIVRLEPGGKRTSWQQLVNPGMPIPAEATAVHGITDLDVALAPKLEDVADEILKELDGCDIGGFNVMRFDIPLLAEELSRVGKFWDCASLRVVDVQRIYHRMEPRDLSAAVRFYCERDHAGAHDALADVEATADVLLAQLERYPSKLQGTVDFLGELSGDRQRSPDPSSKLKFDDSGTVCFNVGKYAGWNIENVARNDPGYIDWFMNKSDFPQTTKAVVRAALEHAA